MILCTFLSRFSNSLTVQKGFVTNVLAKNGTATDESPVLSMADRSSSLKFKTQIAKEEKKYIKAGEKVSLELEDSFDIITNLTVSSITVNKDDPSMLDVTVNIPKGKGEINENAKLVLDDENSKPYLCVPIEAVRDGDNEKYVLILKKVKKARLVFGYSYIIFNIILKVNLL